MAGKKKTEKQGSSWIGEIEKYSRQIWLAGLGAYSKISNDGSKLFETLVKDGEQAEKQTQAQAEQKLEEVKDGVRAGKSRVGDVKDLALGKWSELEGAFDKRLNSAISRLGVPSRSEVESLHDKVDRLTRQIEQLTGEQVQPVTTTRAASRPASGSTAKPLIKSAAKTVAKTADKVASKADAAKPAVKKAAAKPVDAASKAASATASSARSAAASADTKPAKKPAPRKRVAKPAAKPAAEKEPASAAPASPATEADTGASASQS
ncbi:poly(hydroxyalkanoate) granule-associated protein [Pseudomonas sp. Leaf127]|uniref:phasin family protein n=1 Tax=Pseudomonas sp. Leaf127 TaxID=1736267 RepID=UPI000703444E|nr:phasin family protein [Pseudomonas sp. Leaf127]KQQ53973.1 poly(hydroxyalkanoate) granule-associated protein [Pseudomonas sp. Leaf127]